MLKLIGLKNKKNVQISIVGFGRPKFGGSGAAKPAAPAAAAPVKVCPTCNQHIK